MTAMLALVGEQSQPNFIPVLHYKPACVIFVYTTKTDTTYKNQKKVLEKRNIKVYGIQTDPYDIAAIVQAINKRLAEIAKQSDVMAQSLKSLVFNLTGGTKIMSLAAYQVAARIQAPVIYFQSEKGKSIVDYYSWQDHQLSRQRQEELPEYLHLEDVLELHLGPRKDPKGGEMWNVKRPARLSGDGHKLELAIAQTLKDHGYETLCGVEDRSGSLDIDVMIRYHNRIGIIEAKSSEKGVVEDLEAIQQLSATKNFLRGTYTQPFMVINSKSNANQQMVCKLLGISIISLPHYKRGTSILSQEEINILLPAIDEAMKVEPPKS